MEERSSEFYIFNLSGTSLGTLEDSWKTTNLKHTLGISYPLLRKYMYNANIQRKYNEENFCGVRKHFFFKKKNRMCDIFQGNDDIAYTIWLFCKDFGGMSSCLPCKMLPILVTYFNLSSCSHIFFFQSGNYYSLRSQHEKAALYFQRALKLNPRYLGAWTLMGHEYMEMKNTSAAIQAYR